MNDIPSLSYDPNLTARDREFIRDLVANEYYYRRELADRLKHPNRDIYQDCGYPETSEITPEKLLDLYDRFPIATRAVDLAVDESWRVLPTVYETEDEDQVTEFEAVWKDINKKLRGEKSWYQSEQDAPVWEYLQRADRLSRIGHYGVLLLELDDVGTMRKDENGMETVITWKDPAPGFEDADPEQGMVTNPEEKDDKKKGKGKDEKNSKKESKGLLGSPNDKDAEELDKKDAAEEDEDKKKKLANNFDFKKKNEDEDEEDEDTSEDPKASSNGKPKDGSPEGLFGKGKDGEDDSEQVDEDEEEVEEDDSLGLDDEDDEDGKDGKAKKMPVQLVGLRTFDQTHAEVSEWYEDEMNDGALFGRPRMYRITLGEQESTGMGAVTSVGVRERQVDVHWSRIVHLADNLANSEYIGIPTCRPIVNELLDLQKIYGASGEGYWRTAFPGLSFETHPQLGGRANLDTASIKEEVQKYQDTLQRYMATSGGSVKVISGQVTDPTVHIEIRIEAICIVLGCPVRIFKGSERGELASSQDKDSWDERMVLRQQTYITPRIIIPFIDRLITIGVLPEPEGYSIDWPDLTTMSQTAKADLAVKKVQALTQYISGGADSLISPLDFLVDFMDYDQEEAQQIADSALEHVNSANPNAPDIGELGQAVKQPNPFGPDGGAGGGAPPYEVDENGVPIDAEGNPLDQEEVARLDAEAAAGGEGGEITELPYEVDDQGVPIDADGNPLDQEEIARLESEAEMGAPEENPLDKFNSKGPQDAEDGEEVDPEEEEDPKKKGFPFAPKKKKGLEAAGGPGFSRNELVEIFREVLSSREADLVDNHTPGGKEHDQQDHGNRNRELPSAMDEDELDEAKLRANEQGALGFFVDEGTNESISVFMLKPTVGLKAGRNLAKNKKGPTITLYRGVGPNSPAQGNYYSTDREWARQFTQTGSDSEVRSITVALSDLMDDRITENEDDGDLDLSSVQEYLEGME